MLFMVVLFSIGPIIGLIVARWWAIKGWIMRWSLNNYLRFAECPCNDLKTASVCIWLNEPDPPPCHFPDFWVDKVFPDSWGMGCEDA